MLAIQTIVGRLTGGRKNAESGIQPIPDGSELPARLSLEQQWQRVAAILENAQARASTAAEAHRNAARQLDAAFYAIQGLKSEIAPVLDRADDRNDSQVTVEPLRVTPRATPEAA